MANRKYIFKKLLKYTKIQARIYKTANNTKIINNKVDKLNFIELKNASFF